MKASNLSFVPLNQASLCLDCEMITVGTSACVACGSSAVMNVARTLGQPRHTRRFTAHTAHSRHVERRAFFAQHNRVSSQDFGLVCRQGE
jgi:hypothetical protein